MLELRTVNPFEQVRIVKRSTLLQTLMSKRNCKPIAGSSLFSRLSFVQFSAGGFITMQQTDKKYNFEAIVSSITLYNSGDGNSQRCAKYFVETR